MALRSQLLRDDARLQACAVSDPAHVVPGASGPHVGRIQQALAIVDNAAIVSGELGAMRYGPSTASAVLGFKSRRDIVNHAYQSQPDDIVGKMTIVALDDELARGESATQPKGAACALYCACPIDRSGHRQGFAASDGAAAYTLAVAPAPVPGAPLPIPSPRDAVMAEALRFAKQCLWDAIGDLMSLMAAIRSGGPYEQAQERNWWLAQRWLKFNSTDRPAALPTLEKAVDLMRRNHALKASSGRDIELRHAPGEGYHALSHMDSPDWGLNCGDPFFDVDGPNCRRDVMVHEFFHMIGVHHGGGELLAPTVRDAITTPVQALDSADNLAQLIAELRTFKWPNIDACTRPGD